MAIVGPVWHLPWIYPAEIRIFCMDVLWEGKWGNGVEGKNNQIFLLAKTRRSSLEIGNSDIHYLVHSCVLTQWSKHRMCYMRDSSHDVI